MTIATTQDAPGLNAAQRAFCAAYVATHNATQAAKDAGYSAKTAHAQGHRLLKNAEVRAEIERLESMVLDDLGVTAYYVAKRLKDIADNGGNRDALRALELLGKWRGLWADKVELSGDVVFTMEIPKPGAD